MANIYDYKNGHLITGGLQGCKICDEAIDAARYLAVLRDSPVHLNDDDGDWIVYPDGGAERIEVKRCEGIDKPGQVEQTKYWDDPVDEDYY